MVTQRSETIRPAKRNRSDLEDSNAEAGGKVSGQGDGDDMNSWM